MLYAITYSHLSSSIFYFFHQLAALAPLSPSRAMASARPVRPTAVPVQEPPASAPVELGSTAQTVMLPSPPAPVSTDCFQLTEYQQFLIAY